MSSSSAKAAAEEAIAKIRAGVATEPAATQGQAPARIAPTAFPPAFVEEVKKASEGAVQDDGGNPQPSLEPTYHPPMVETEQKQLMLHGGCAEASLILQQRTYLQVGQTSGAKNWRALEMCTEQQMADMFPYDDMHIVLVLDEDEIKDLYRIRKALEPLSYDRLDLLVWTKTEKDMFPFAPRLAEASPWKLATILKLHRGLVFQGGDCKWAFYAQSSRVSRTAGLQPEIRALRIAPLGENVTRVVTRVPAAPDSMVAIVVPSTVTGDVFSWLGYTGRECVSVPGPIKPETRVVFANLGLQQWAQLVTCYAGVPYFSVMSMDEYLGESFEDDPLVAEIYSYVTHKQRLVPKMWEMIHNYMRQKFPGVYKIQVLAKNKLRVSITTQKEADLFRSSALQELDGMGFVVKDERTQRRMEAEPEISDPESVTSSVAEGKQGVIIYDVPPWIQEADLLQMLDGLQACAPLTEAKRVGWTPGRPQFQAWRVEGPDAAVLAGYIIGASGLSFKRQEIKGITLRDYYTAKKESREFAERRRQGGGRDRDRQWARPSFGRVQGQGQGQGHGQGQGQRPVQDKAGTAGQGQSTGMKSTYVQIAGSAPMDVSSPEKTTEGERREHGKARRKI